MSKRVRILLFAFAAGSVIPAIMWIHYAVLHGDPSFSLDFDAMLWLTAVFMLPAAIAASVSVAQALYERLRAPDIIITVTPCPAPLESLFQEQDIRLEKRERLKAELFKLNSEIETFNAGMDQDTRHAWFNRPGPYGK